MKLIISKKCRAWTWRISTNGSIVGTGNNTRIWVVWEINVFSYLIQDHGNRRFRGVHEGGGCLGFPCTKSFYSISAKFGWTSYNINLNNSNTKYLYALIIKKLAFEKMCTTIAYIAVRFCGIMRNIFTILLISIIQQICCPTKTIARNKISLKYVQKS